jgi:hypothetical protein
MHSVTEQWREGRLADATRIFANHADPRESPLHAWQLVSRKSIVAEFGRDDPVPVRGVIRVDPRGFAGSAFPPDNAVNAQARHG